MKRAFTHWELIVALIGLCLGAAILFPVFEHARVNAARPPICQSQLKAIGLAFGEYKVDSDGIYPPVLQGSTGRGWADALLPYTTRATYRCRDAELAAPAPQQAGGPVRTDYFYNARLAGRRANRPLDAEYTIMLGDGEAGMDSLSPHYAIDALPAVWLGAGPSPRRRHDDGSNFLFEDGHTTWVNAREGIPALHSKDAWFSFAPK